MSDFMKPRLEEIRERMNRATPGPWGWFGNTAVNHVYLATQRWGRHMVMTFERWGMQSAQPAFYQRPDQDQVRQSIVTDSTFVKASDVPVYEVAPQARSKKDPAVYREDIVALRNADASFIAHSRADVEWLVGEVDRLQSLLDAGTAANTAEATALRLVGWHCEHRWNTPSDGTHMKWDDRKKKLVRESNVHASWHSSLWAKDDPERRCPHAVPVFVVATDPARAAS
jgi:hypothetical protein